MAPSSKWPCWATFLSLAPGDQYSHRSALSLSGIGEICSSAARPAQHHQQSSPRHFSRLPSLIPIDNSILKYHPSPDGPTSLLMSAPTTFTSQGTPLPPPSPLRSAQPCDALATMPYRKPPALSEALANASMAQTTFPTTCGRPQ